MINEVEKKVSLQPRSCKLNNKTINECTPNENDLTQLSRSHAVPIKITSTTVTNKITPLLLKKNKCQ